MKLLYIWIDDTNFLDGVEINFSSTKSFDFDKEKCNLTFHPTNFTVDSNDFFPNNIVNINALIGENGSGKTTIINYFRDHICQQTHLRTGSISVWEDDNHSIKINHNLYNFKFQGQETKSCNFDSNFPEVVLFSNVFDGRGVNTEYGVKNISRISDNSLPIQDYSLNSFVNSDHYTTAIETSKQYYNQGSIETAIINDTFSYIKKSEYRKLFNILQSKIKFMPNVLSLQIYDYQNIPESLAKDELNILEKYIGQTKNSYGDLINPTRFNKVCCNKFGVVNSDRHCFEVAILNTSINLWFLASILSRSNQRLDLNLTLFFDCVVENDNEKLNSLDILLNIINLADCDFLKPIEYFADFVLKNFKFDKSFSTLNDRKLSALFVEYKDDSAILEYFSLIDNMVGIFNNVSLSKDEPLFKISLEFGKDKGNPAGFSTGQLMNLRMYIELVKAYHNSERENIILIIDEWDLYYHPSLQITGLNDLITFLNTIYDNKKVQILLTTNSPFLLSDLPLSNIIHLKRGKVEKQESQTFGQNISTLLKNQFFLKSSIGEFASQKINKIIDEIKPITKSEERLQYPKIEFLRANQLRQEISIIGDHLVRNKLNDMLDMCVYQGSNKASHINRLSAKIERLESEKRMWKNDTNKN